MSARPACDIPEACLDRESRTYIGDRLRAMHDDIVRQGISDRFADLLSQLDKRAKGVRQRSIR